MNDEVTYTVFDYLFCGFKLYRYLTGKIWIRLKWDNNWFKISSQKYERCMVINLLERHGYIVEDYR